MKKNYCCNWLIVTHDNQKRIITATNGNEAMEKSGLDITEIKSCTAYNYKVMC